MASNENASTDERITANNVEEELKKLKIIDDYDSDEYEQDRVCLTGAKIDLKALTAGQDVEFEINDTNEYLDDYEKQPKIDYEKLLQYRNFEMVCGEDDKVDPSNSADSKTPFEVLRLKMEDVSPKHDGGVMKRILTPGYGAPIETGSHVRVHYNAYFEMNDEPFDSTHLRNKSFEFRLGAMEVVYGLDISVATMKRKEKSQFIFEPEYYCGKLGCEPRVPKETAVLFEIEVISVLELSPLDEFRYSCQEERNKMPFKKILLICNCLRELGNDNFSRKCYHDASVQYRKAIYLMENKSAKNEEEEKKTSGILLKLYLNMSQISMKQAKPKKCIYYCKLALNIHKDNTKANFRYGQALRILQDFDRSKHYLFKALGNEPANRDIIREIEKLDEMVKNYNLLETDMYRKMFKSNDNLLTTNETKSSNDNLSDMFTDQNNNKSNGLAKLTKDTALNEQTKEYIVNKLKEFMENPKLKVHSIQPDMYPKSMVTFIEEQADKLGLVVRKIVGTPNLLQILKESDKK